MTAERSFEPNRIRTAKQDSGGQGPSRVGRAVGIFLLMALLGGAGWYVWQQGGLDFGGTQMADSDNAATDSSGGGLARGPDSAALTSDDVEQGAQALDAPRQHAPRRDGLDHCRARGGDPRVAPVDPSDRSPPGRRARGPGDAQAPGHPHPLPGVHVRVAQPGRAPRDLSFRPSLTRRRSTLRRYR